MMHHPDAPNLKRGPLRTVLVVALSVLVVGFIFRLTEAGSLTPSSAPATDSMPSLASISDPIFGSDYDSSDVTAKKDHSILNWTKCIIGQLKGFDRCNFDFDKSPTPICVAGVTADFDAGQNASVSWMDFMASGVPTAVAISEYEMNFAFGVTGSSQYSDFEIGLGCSFEGVTLASASACNGSACDYCLTSVTVSDPFAVCP